jgi:hypothetical protein
MTSSLEIIKKHLCPEVPLVLKNSDGTEDTIMLKPLDTSQQALLFKISKKMQNAKEGEMDEDTIKEMFDLYKGIVKKSIQDIDDETLDNFVVTNFTELSETLEKLVPKQGDSEKLESIKKRLEQRKENKV